MSISSDSFICCVYYIFRTYMYIVYHIYQSWARDISKLRLRDNATKRQHNRASGTEKILKMLRARVVKCCVHKEYRHNAISINCMAWKHCYVVAAEMLRAQLWNRYICLVGGNTSGPLVGLTDFILTMNNGPNGGNNKYIYDKLAFRRKAGFIGKNL